ncbi:KH domain protein [Cooperia oncophora]
MPNTSAGMVIGKSGANIKDIRETYGCQIQVFPKAGSPEAQNSLERIVTLAHEDHAQLIQATCRVLERVVADPHHGSEISKEDYGAKGGPLLSFLDNLQSTLRSSGFNEASVAEVMQAMQVLAKYNIMGLGLGLGVAAMAQMRSAQETTPQTNHGVAGFGDQSGHIGGGDVPTSVNLLLVDVLRSQSGAAANGENFAASVMVERNITSDSVELEVPDSVVGAVLGPKAKTLQEIQFYSGCKVQVFKRDAKADVPAGTRLISLTGDEKNMRMCRLMIERVVNEAQERRVGKREI